MSIFFEEFSQELDLGRLPRPIWSLEDDESTGESMTVRYIRAHRINYKL